MIASLTGILKSKSATEALIDVHGVGYLLSIPVSTYERLGEPGSEVSVLTYLHVREDILQLFGFATDEERRMFRLLLSVSGIGPRIAQGILSGISIADLRRHIASGNVGALTSIPNVGKKTAERIVVELRDKMTDVHGTAGGTENAAGSPSDIRSETLLALTSLGYNRAVAEKAIRRALQDVDPATATVETLVKLALKHTGNP